MKKILFISFFIVFLFCSLNAQVLAKNPKNPAKAALLSALIPAGGQYYNQSYIKAGIVTGIQTFLIANLIHHNNQVSHYKNKMRNALNKQQYNLNKQKYLSSWENRQNTGWWIGSTMLLSMLDAYVDAHLYNFKTTKKNLKLKFNPRYIGLALEF